MSGNLRSEIVVKVDDQQAQTQLDSIIKKLERAAELAERLRVGDGRPGSGGAGDRGGPGGGGGGGGGGGDRDRPDRPQDMSTGPSLGDRITMAITKGMEGAAGAGMGMRSDPAAMIRHIGKSINDLTDAAYEHFTAMVESLDMGSIVTGAVSKAAFIAGKGAAMYMRVMAEAAQVRMENIGKVMALEGPETMMKAVGGIDKAPNSASDVWGFQPAEAAQLTASFLGSGGVQGAGAHMGDKPVKLTRSGMSPEMTARIMSMGGKGGGFRGGVGAATTAAGRMIGFAESQGLRGRKTDELLARMAAGVTQMAEQGIEVDQKALTSSLAKLSAHGRGLRRSGENNVFEGMHAARVANQMMRAGSGASRKFSGSFGDLAGTGIQAWAFQQTDDPLEAMALMEGLSSDPMAARKALMEIYGGDEMMVGLALHQMGMSARQAQTLAKPGEADRRLGRQPGSSFGTADSAGMKLSAFAAKKERELIDKTRGMTDNTVFMDTMYTIQNVLLDASKDTAKFQREILKFIQDWL